MRARRGMNSIFSGARTFKVISCATVDRAVVALPSVARDPRASVPDGALERYGWKLSPDRVVDATIRLPRSGVFPLPLVRMTTHPIRTRFAPSPTGLLHLGNIRTALFNFLLARRTEGSLLLRLEDTDAARGHERYAMALQEDLRWLGFTWDEGPGVGGPHGPYAQSRRGEIYRQHFAALESQGRAYPCFCSEQELAVSRKTRLAAGLPPRYSGRCRTLTAEEVRERLARGLSATLRFHVEDGSTVEFDDKVRGHQVFKTDEIGDFIIRRSDGTPAFFFCNAVDDALMGVSLVVRGEDHLANTPRQLLLLRALDLPAPVYAHIAMVVGADGAPLSKRTGSRSAQELRAAGYLPLAINNYLARLGHTYASNELMGLTELAAGFSVDRLHKAPARYDETQLLYWQREAIRRSSADTLWEWMNGETRALVSTAQRAEFIETVRANVTFPADARHWARILFTEEVPISRAARETLDGAGSDFFKRALRAIDSMPVDFNNFSRTFRDATGVSGKKLFRPLRAALTGEVDGPELARLLALMTRERVRERLRRASEE